MQKLINHLGHAALGFFIVSAIGLTLGASTMSSIWITTRMIDRAERAAIKEAKEVETRRETARDPLPEPAAERERPEDRRTWARYEKTGEIVDTAKLDAMLPETDGFMPERTVRVKQDAVPQFNSEF